MMNFRKIVGQDLIFQLLSIFWAFFLNFRLHFSGQPIHHIFDHFQRINYKFSLHFSGKLGRTRLLKSPIGCSDDSSYEGAEGDRVRRVIRAPDRRLQEPSEHGILRVDSRGTRLSDRDTVRHTFLFDSQSTTYRGSQGAEPPKNNILKKRKINFYNYRLKFAI